VSVSDVAPALTDLPDLRLVAASTLGELRHHENHPAGRHHENHPAGIIVAAGTPGVIGGPSVAELDEITHELSVAVALGDLPDLSWIKVSGALLAIARGPYGSASQLALDALLDARQADLA
jgi:hypothetical protein